MESLVQQINDARSRLLRALHAGQSHLNCLRLWSAFIRLRDGNRCVQCNCKHDLAAHHIFRKSFLAAAQYEPGNGITLCRKCHKEVHDGFNGKPDMSQPMDAQGGEKAEHISIMLELLLIRSRQHQAFTEEWYYLSDSTLATISLLQGFSAEARLDTSRIEQACIVWNQAPGVIRDAIFQANGFAPFNEPICGGIHIIYSKGP